MVLGESQWQEEQFGEKVIDEHTRDSRTAAMRLHLNNCGLRHAETAWSASGQCTGRTDLPLTRKGQHDARKIGESLMGHGFVLVLSSPLQRALETCRLAGYGDIAIIDPNLQEWDYGEYEGRTATGIQKQRPGWSVWRDGVPGGEIITDVAARAQVVIDRVLALSGDVLLFAHGDIRSPVAGWA